MEFQNIDFTIESSDRKKVKRIKVEHNPEEETNVE